MSSTSFFVKLLLSLACLAASIFVIVQGQSCINEIKASREQAENKVLLPPENESPKTQPDDKSAGLLAKLKENTWELNKATKEFETDRNEITKELQDKQAKITAGSQYSQILFRITQEILAASTDSKGAVKDAKLKGLLSQSGIQVNNPPHNTTSPPSTPALPTPPPFTDPTR